MLQTSLRSIRGRDLKIAQRLLSDFVPIKIADFIDKRTTQRNRQILYDQQMKEIKHLDFAQLVNLTFKLSQTDLRIDFDLFAEELIRRKQEQINMSDISNEDFSANKC